jgi:hypothetical protein
VFTLSLRLDAERQTITAFHRWWRDVLATLCIPVYPALPVRRHKRRLLSVATLRKQRDKHPLSCKCQAGNLASAVEQAGVALNQPHIAEAHEMLGRQRLRDVELSGKARTGRLVRVLVLMPADGYEHPDLVFDEAPLIREPQDTLDETVCTEFPFEEACSGRDGQLEVLDAMVRRFAAATAVPYQRTSLAHKSLNRTNGSQGLWPVHRWLAGIPES